MTELGEDLVGPDLVRIPLRRTDLLINDTFPDPEKDGAADSPGGEGSTGTLAPSYQQELV